MKHAWQQHRCRRHRGFTLIELMVVMVILVLLAGGVSVVVVNRVEQGRRARAQTDIAALESALDAYHVDTGDYPSEEEGLQALVSPPAGVSNWNGPYIRRPNFNDPWGNPYQYRYPGEYAEFDLFSYGKDGREGGEGNDADITNWGETGG